MSPPSKPFPSACERMLFAAHIEQSVWGQIERAEGPHRLELCRTVALYTPINPKQYSAAKVAALLKAANWKGCRVSQWDGWSTGPRMK